MGSVKESLEILEKVSNIATLSDIRGIIDEENMHFKMGFELPEGREQVVYVRPSAKVAKDETVVTFFSPCLVIKGGFLKGISREQAVDLLRRNEKILFARYGLWQIGKDDMVVASVDQLLNTLDPEEFNAHAWNVAIAADMYEKEHGKDIF